MSIQIIRDGQEELIRSATNYVTGLGVPLKNIHALSVGGTVGGPLSIIVEIHVDPERIPNPSEARTEVFLRVPRDDGSAHQDITR